MKVGEERRDLIREVSVVKEAPSGMTISAVASLDTSVFRQLQGHFSGGYTRQVHWLRIALQRRQDAGQDWLLEVAPAYLDDLRLYTPDGAGGWREQKSGDLQPFSTRTLPYRHATFRLHLPDAQPRVFYLRLQTTSTSAARLTLWNESAFEAASRQDYLWLGCFLGAIVFLLLTSLIYWRRFRHLYYLLFIGHAGGGIIAFLGINGLAAQYLFPQHPEITSQFASIGACLVVMFSTGFFMEFLGIKRKWFGIYPVYCLSILLAAISIAGSVFGFYVDTAPWTFLASQLLIPPSLWVAWRSMRKGVLGSNWLFYGYACYCFLITLNLLAAQGIIPSYSFALMGWQLGLLIFIIFLQQGMLARLHNNERQRIEAQARIDKAETQRDNQRKFMALVAHELKTPLAVIDSAVQALDYGRKDKEDEDVTARHHRIRDAVLRLNDLLEKTLANDRALEDGLAPRFAMIPVDVLIDEVIASSGLPKSRLEIREEPGIVCRGDRILLRLALGNLLENAVKYGLPGKAVFFQADREVRESRQGICFHVVNQYGGSAEEDASCWLEKFCRGMADSGEEGNGLGLYLVNAIARVHGGEVVCKIEPNGEGNRVIAALWIPDMSAVEGAP